MEEAVSIDANIVFSLMDFKVAEFGSAVQASKYLYLKLV